MTRSHLSFGNSESKMVHVFRPKAGHLPICDAKFILLPLDAVQVHQRHKDTLSDMF